VEAFSKMSDRRLVVVGDGKDSDKVKARSGGNIELLGHQPSEVLVDYMRRARAVEKDFGIVPVEARACGTPVVAYGKGGVLETVIEGRTGMFFRNQTVESLIEAVGGFDRREDGFDPNEIRKNAERFGTKRFGGEFKDFVDTKIREFFYDKPLTPGMYRRT